MVKSGSQTSPQDMEIVAGILSAILILLLMVLVQYEDWYEIGVNVKKTDIHQCTTLFRFRSAQNSLQSVLLFE